MQNYIFKLYFLCSPVPIGLRTGTSPQPTSWGLWRATATRTPKRKEQQKALIDAKMNAQQN